MELSPESPKKEVPRQISGGASLSSTLSPEHEVGPDMKKTRVETQVESLLKRYAHGFGFKKISKTDRGHTFSMAGDIEKIDGKWRSTIRMDELFVGPENIDRLRKTYKMWPDLASSVIELGVMHERFESYLTKTIDKQIEIEMLEYGIKELGFNEKDEKRFAIDFARTHSARARRDSQANLRVAVSFLGSGMGPELVKEKIAANVWYLNTYPSYDAFDRMSKNEREAKIREMANGYLHDYFPWLKQKGEVVEKTIKVDREYQKRLYADLNVVYQ